MSYQSDITYLEYYAPHGDEMVTKSYYVKVKSPETLINVSTIENTPESNHQRTDNQQDNDPSLTPVRKIYPARTYLEDSLAMSSSFTITPDKDGDVFSPDRSRSHSMTKNQDSGKRGRPRADVINSLIMEGSQSGSSIKCKICNRVFPREKSLQAHLRTHTGERPYNCDYPGCTRAFTQSGQLKTHQRLHAGEKPFVCSEAGCGNRYTHANRQCPDHPYAKPQRTSELILQPNISASEDKDKVFAWLEKYKREKDERTPGKFAAVDQVVAHDVIQPVDAKRNRSKRGLTEEMDQCFDQENVPSNIGQYTPGPAVHSVNFSSPNTPRQTPSTNQRSLFAKQTLSQALQRAAESQACQRNPVPGPAGLDDYIVSTPVVLSDKRFAVTAPSPMKRELLDAQSPLKGIRRTLGDITPTKNCRSDQFHSDLELPFNFGLPTSPAFSNDLHQLRTPISAEKSLSSPIVHGSPALKLKKRFQERFQEEKLIEREELAKPILWKDDDFTTPVKRFSPSSSSVFSSSSPNKQEISSSPYSQFSSPIRETNSPTLLVAAALVELQDTSREDIPLNLTKHK